MEELEIYIHTSHDGNEIRKVSFEVLNERPQNVSKKGYTFYNDNPLDELGVGLFIYNGTNWVNVFTEYEHFKRTDNVTDFDFEIDDTIDDTNNTISIIKKLTITDEGHIKDIEFIDIDYSDVGAAKAMHTHNTEDIIFNSPDRLLGSANDGATFELSADNVLTFLSIAKGEIGDLINYNQLDNQHRVWTASTIIEYVSSVVGQQITGALVYQNTGYIGQNDPGTLILPIPEGGATIPIDKGMVWVVSTDGFFGTERVEGGDMIIALVDNATNDDDFQVINKNITLVAATSLISGLVKLFSDTIQTEVANDVTSTSGRTYGIQANSSGQLVVNVPWTDTTYTTDTLGILNDGQSTSGALQSSKNLNDWLFSKGFLTNVNLIGYATEAWVLSQNYVNVNTVTQVGTTSANMTSGDILIVGGGSASVSKSGNTITISSTDTNTTYTGSTSISLVSGSFQRAALTGDVTAAQNSNATTIANNAVTFTKMQNIATQRLLGRGAAGSGNIEELTLGSGLSLSTAGVLSATGSGGTVSSVAMSVPTGLTVTGSPITSSGTLTLGFASGYSLPTISKQEDWDTALNKTIKAVTVTGTTTKTITLTREDDTVLTANWSDNNADTITRLRGTTTGTYTSGDLTLLAGNNVTISQSGSNITIGSTDTNYTGGTGISISGTTINNTAPNITQVLSLNGNILELSNGGSSVTLPSSTRVGTTSGNVTSGDILIVGGGSASVSKSGNTITITGTNSTYTAGTGITLTGTTFSHTAHTGDVTGSTALTIANNAVTFAKMQNIATQRILGRGTTGAGNIEELTLGTGLSLSTTGILSATGSGGTVTSVGLTIAGNALNTNLATITSSGTFGLTWAGTTAQYIRGDGSLATMPTIPTVGNGSLSIGTPTGLTTTGTFTANQSGNSTITLAYDTGYQGYTTAEATKLAGIEANANKYTLPTATDTVLGGVKLFNDTVQTVAANTITTTASRTYGIQTNASGQLVVNVPWVDNNTNTIYTGSTSIILSGTSFQRAALTGDITSAQNSNTTTIANNVVTFTKMQNISTQTILGRYDSGTGNVQEITLGSGLSLSASGVLSSTSVGGTVTSVAMSVPTGLTVSGSPITSSGTLAVGFASGYSLPTTAKQGQWDTAYGWGNHAGLYSLLNHTHVTSNITALTGYTLGTNTALTATMSLNTALGNLQAQINAKTSNSGTVTSVGMTIAGNALNTNTATITSSGTFGLTWGGTAAQYVNGQGALVTFPTIPTINNGQLTLSTGTGLSGSATFTANQSGSSTFSVSVASTHKLPTTAEWNALPTTDTITRLRGTTSGTFTSGDLTLLAGTNTTITQSGSNITITSTNTTYSDGTLALLQAGTNTTNRVWSAKILADGVIRKGVHNVNPAGEPFSIEANNGRLSLNQGGRFRFEEFGDQDCFFEFRHDEGPGLVVGHNHVDYEGTLAMGYLRFYGNGVSNTLSHNLNGYSRTRLPVTGTAVERVLTIGAKLGSNTYYANEQGVIELPAFANSITSISRNGTNIPIVSQNVDIPIFSTSGAGLVPARVGSVATKYLREDGTWVTPTNTTYSAGTGLALNGTVFSQEITYLGGGSFVTQVVQNENGLTVILGEPTNTITRIRANSNGTYATGQITLLPGSNVSLTQSGGNITIDAVNTNTTYSAGNGISLTGTTFGQTITTSGTGSFVTGIIQTSNGFEVKFGTPSSTAIGVNNNNYTTGNINLIPGSNMSIVKNGNNITFSSTGGGGGTGTLSSDSSYNIVPSVNVGTVKMNFHEHVGLPPTYFENPSHVGNMFAYAVGTDTMDFYGSYDNVQTIELQPGENDVNITTRECHITNVIGPLDGLSIYIHNGIYAGDQVNINILHGYQINLDGRILSANGFEVKTFCNLIWDLEIQRWVVIAHG